MTARLDKCQSILAASSTVMIAQWSVRSGRRCQVRRLEAAGDSSCLRKKRRRNATFFSRAALPLSIPSPALKLPWGWLMCQDGRFATLPLLQRAAKVLTTGGRHSDNDTPRADTDTSKADNYSPKSDNDAPPNPTATQPKPTMMLSNPTTTPQSRQRQSPLLDFATL